MKTILAPVDFSSGTTSILAEAAALARAFDALLILLHIIDPLPSAAGEFELAEAAARMRAAAMAEAVRELGMLQRELSESGTTALTHHVVGIPGLAIVEQARVFAANYIVIGSHGHSALYELVVGGTASRVIKEAPCPVVVVSSIASESYIAASPMLESVGTTAR